MPVKVRSNQTLHFSHCPQYDKADANKDTPVKLKYGLLKLMESKKFEKICVKELVDYIGVSRGTFYLHYEDIYALVEEIEQELLDLTDTKGHINIPFTTEYYNKPHPILYSALKGILLHQYENCILLGKNGEPSFEGKCKKLFQKNVIEKIFHDNNVSKNRNLIISYLANGHMALIEQWLFVNPYIPVEEVTIILTRLVFNAFYKN